MRPVVMVGWFATATTLLAPGQASAQFFWNQPRLSADDAARAAMGRGFRVLARPVRNDDVYVADVVNRRGQRERLIINAESGQIVQHFSVDYGGRLRREQDPTIPRGPVPPASIPEERPQPNFFSRLFGDDAPETRPPLAPDESIAPPAPRPRPKRPPRVVERTPEPARASPIESAPLAAPTSGAPEPNAAPASTVALPPASAPSPAASDRPMRAIVTDPLAIPGTREQDDSRATAAAAAKGSKAAAKPGASDVPVAPLD